MKKYVIVTSILIVMSGIFNVSCHFFSSKPSLFFNMKGSLALGSAVGKNSRAAEEDGGTLELKKITTNGSEYVLNFENANTKDFLVRHVVKDPYGASTDVYVVLDHPTRITDKAIIPTQELYLGQIIAIHEDGSYTSFPEWHNGDDYGWLSSTSATECDTSISFDEDGNMYYIYNQEMYKSGEYLGSFENLYKYNPTTRENTIISKSPEGSHPEYQISGSHEWGVLETHKNSYNDLDIYYLDGKSNKIHINSYEKYTYSSDYCYTFHNKEDILYYEAVNPETENPALYKLEPKNGTFNSEDKELLLDGFGDFYGKRCFISTETGIWGCSSTMGICHIIDENENAVLTVYPAVNTSTYSVDFQKSGNNIFIATKTSLYCFDTVSKTYSDVLSKLPDSTNLTLNSYSISKSKLTYSARNNLTGETINGIIDLLKNENTLLNSTENFVSIVLINENTTE